jgi:hypothetical protein
MKHLERVLQKKKRNQRVTATKKKRKISVLNPDVWIISKGRDSQFDLSTIESGKNSDAVKEYQISDIARYLLNPNPIEVEKRLIGCEIHYPQRTVTKIIQNIKRLFPRRLRRHWNGNGIPPEVLISNCKLKIPSLTFTSPCAPMMLFPKDCPSLIPIKSPISLEFVRILAGIFPI